MAVRTPESIIIGAIHGALTSYPEGDGGPHLDYQWIQPEHSAHVTKAILAGLAANGFEIVKKKGVWRRCWASVPRLSPSSPGISHQS
jgi:hypothetical protein